MKAPTRKKSEEQVMAATKAAATARYLGLKKWRAVRKSMTTSTGWSRERYDGWLAQKVESGTFKVCKSHPKAGTAALRKEAIAIAAGGVKRQRQLNMEKVRQWLKGRLDGTYISAPMVRQMEHNLTARGNTRTQVAAAIILVAMEDHMKVEDRRQGVGGSESKWVTETVQWAHRQGWLQAGNQTLSTVQKAASQLVNPHPHKKETVCIEFGSGWEGATKGLKQVYDRVITVDRERQHIGPARQANPDYLIEFSTARNKKEGIVKYIAQQAGVRKGELQAVWMSPDCTEETVAQAINKGKKGGAGFYAGMKRSDEAQAALETLIEGTWLACQQDPKIQVCLENPAVTALSLEPMITDKWGKGEVVMGCAYGAPTKKPYRLWLTTRTRNLLKKKVIHPASPRSECLACKSVPRLKHSMTVLPGKTDKTPRTSKNGVYVRAARNMVPANLAKQVGQCMLQAYANS